MTPKNYTLQMPRRVLAGQGVLEQLATPAVLAPELALAVVVDEGVKKAGLLAKPVQILNGRIVRTICIPTREPEIADVEAQLQRLRAVKVDLVIGLGGGSVMDTAKILAALYPTTLTISEVLGADKIPGKGLPTLMIPTTAGTGAEATPNAIVGIPAEKLKIGIVSPHLVPDTVLLDPTMTRSLPPAVTAATGMDALAHALECFISLKANPFSDHFALKGLELIFHALPRAFEHGDDLAARENMLLAAFFGGVCIASSGTTAVHALAYPLGGEYHIPHGVANAMLLAPVMRFNRDWIADRLVQVASYIGVTTPQEVITALETLVVRLQIPSKLTDFGITAQQLDALAQSAARVERLLNNNPRKLSVAEIKSIYQELL
jgi:alcohol dehydrogenase